MGGCLIEDLWYSVGMTVDITTVIVVGAVLAILNFLSVFGALATLRWRDQKQKRAVADIFLRELGEKLETEANFQDIVRNMNVIPKDKKDTEEDEDD